MKEEVNIKVIMMYKREDSKIAPFVIALQINKSKFLPNNFSYNDSFSEKNNNNNISNSIQNTPITVFNKNHKGREDDDNQYTNYHPTGYLRQSPFSSFGINHSEDRRTYANDFQT